MIFFLFELLKIYESPFFPATSGNMASISLRPKFNQMFNTEIYSCQTFHIPIYLTHSKITCSCAASPNVNNIYEAKYVLIYRNYTSKMQTLYSIHKWCMQHNGRQKCMGVSWQSTCIPLQFWPTTSYPLNSPHHNYVDRIKHTQWQWKCLRVDWLYRPDSKLLSRSVTDFIINQSNNCPLCLGTTQNLTQCYRPHSWEAHSLLPC